MLTRKINIVLVIFSIFILSGISVLGQESLYIPRNIQKAYTNGTRSSDGMPGKNYWQNSSDYKIQVKIEPKNKMLAGKESITYHNNSPDTLKHLVIRLYQNLNKIGAARDFNMDTASITGGDMIKSLSVNEFLLDPDTSSLVSLRGTNLFLKLKNPLTPKSSINLSFEWEFKIPNAHNPRMGFYDSTSFLIGYWYPQMSVYDDIDGWDTYDYTGQQEFYNDFSNYDVEITVPNTFGVWATGKLQNPFDVLNDKYFNRYNNAQTSDDIIHIVDTTDLKTNKIYSQKSENNTWHYKADNVTDFCFGTSDHYLWDAVSLVVDDNTNRRVYIAAVYKEQSKDFYNVDDIARKSINYFSKVFPAVPFPFPSMTVFNGAGGMEFPMVVNDGSYKNKIATVHVTSHEISHTYFPFYMGINETKYAWMDEGMATFIPFDLQAELAPGYNPRAVNASSYAKFAGDEMEMPMIIPSVLLDGASYRVASYRRPGAAYDILRQTLGKETFDRTFREYIKRWNGKHPIPYDFFNTFNKVSKENLDWYWKPWFFKRGYPDLAIKNVEADGNKVKITISRVGDIPIPVNLNITDSDDSISNIYKEASIWKNGDKEITIEKTLQNPVKKIMLGSPIIPDTDLSNNIYLTK